MQLLDRPDDALAIPQAELDAGDEVEVLDLDDIWTRVRTPDGRAGWVPAMTLTPGGAVAEEPDAEAPLAAEINGSDGEGDQPALETLLAIAARRRARIDAHAPVTWDEPRHPPAKSRSERPKKSRKASRRGR